MPPPVQGTSVYDRLRPLLSAPDLLRRLGIEVSRELGSEAYCKPLCHESTSGESLQVNLHTGRWNCKACQHQGVYGDLFQLVEYVLSGGRAPAHGSAQGATSSHRDAVRWLCEQYAIPFDDGKRFGDPALDIVHLFAMQAHEYLLKNEQMLEWVRDRWGFDRATVESYGIGYMPSPLLPEIVAEASRSQAREAFRTSGLGFYPPDGGFRSRFEGRVLFPYLEHGRAVYLIGRATPHTPQLENGQPAPKYHKLTVHSEDRPYISKRITNDHLYNEPILDSTDRVVVAEGVADAVALSSLGVPVVSPVTISFNKTDLERFTGKVKKAAITRVEILFDNELSGSGNYGALRVGRKLVERGLSVSILTLPLGPLQLAARDEVLKALGQELFEELERSDPRRRKEIIAEAIADEARRAWVLQHVEASKIDAAEWVAMEGPGAAGRFAAIRKEGKDVVELEILEAAKNLEGDGDIHARLSVFNDVIELAAHVDDRMVRDLYAGAIAKAAGKGITKAGVAQRIAQARKGIVKEKKEDEAAQPDKAQQEPQLLLLPPEQPHSAPAAPPPPTVKSVPNAPPAPPPPSELKVSEHDRYAPVRESVMKAVEMKASEEAIGRHVAQTITISMGYTAFSTPDDLFLVRGNERVPVGRDRQTARFAQLIYLASGLTSKKTSHRAYIAAAVYFLEREARQVPDVSWSHVGKDRSVYFPTGDSIGRIIRISERGIERLRMSEARVPAVAGAAFSAFSYTEESGGIDEAIRTFRWTSLSESDRLVLIYWIVCLPILRRVGAIPIVRIEGGSSSGKTRAVDAVSYLVNGGKSSSVPTAAALASRLSVEMLTIDDNRESRDISPAFLSILLQATHLGAKEKRKHASDTGTVIERVCGALLMNGIEPIHDGQSEIASRFLTLRCDRGYRRPDSPVGDELLMTAIVSIRDRFWSEAARRCAMALALDVQHGERIGAEIEEVFGETRIGRLSVYMRLMYLAWAAGLDDQRIHAALADLDPMWHDAFSSLGSAALDSLIREEFSVAALRYAFSWCDSIAELPYQGADERSALDGRYHADVKKGDAYLGPVSAPQLARVVRSAAKDLNAPRALSTDLRAGQLEARVLDGLGYLAAAGFHVDIQPGGSRGRRFTFYRGPDPPGDGLSPEREAPLWAAQNAQNGHSGRDGYGLPPEA